MKIENLECKLVLFKFSEEIRHDLSLFQIYNDELWAVVTGVETIGVWVQNPSYELGIWWDDQGRIVSKSDQQKEKFKTDILILWRYIKSLMAVDDDRFQKVPGKKFPGFDSYK